jgi:hypothetical protein
MLLTLSVLEQRLNIVVVEAGSESHVNWFNFQGLPAWLLVQVEQRQA